MFKNTESKGMKHTIMYLGKVVNLIELHDVLEQEGLEMISSACVNCYSDYFNTLKRKNCLRDYYILPFGRMIEGRIGVNSGRFGVNSLWIL